MATLYVRNVPETIYSQLEKEAKSKNISISALLNEIVRMHTMNIDIELIDKRYHEFVKEMVQVYKDTALENQSLLRDIKEDICYLESTINRKGK